MPGSRYDASTKAKAIRLVREHAGDYPTQWAAITAVSGRLGMSAETLRKWIRQAGVDEGKAPGVSSAESAEIRELRRKNRELEQTIEILKAAASFFARECDPRQRLSAGLSMRRKNSSGSHRSAGRLWCTAWKSPRAPTGHVRSRHRGKESCGMPR